MTKFKAFLLIAIFLVIAFVIVTYHSFAQHPYRQAVNENPYSETVTRVHDGDTFFISASWNPYPNLEWSIRVLGIDTPEKGYLAKCQRERDLSEQATALTTRLIAESGNHVTLTHVQHDKYGGRFDANVMLSNGKSLADELLASKLARPYNGNGPKPNWCKS